MQSALLMVKICFVFSLSCLTVLLAGCAEHNDQVVLTTFLFPWHAWLHHVGQGLHHCFGSCAELGQPRGIGASVLRTLAHLLSFDSVKDVGSAELRNDLSGNTHEHLTVSFSRQLVCARA